MTSIIAAIALLGRAAAGLTPSLTPTPCPQLTVVSSAGPIVPGITDTGNHTDDGDTFITLPFPVVFYDQVFNGVNVSSNGRIDFVCVNEPLGDQTQCLPASPNQCPYDYTMFPLWQNLRTDFGLSGCASFPGGTCGIFASLSGIAPNRIFNIEWRTVLSANNASTQNFEVRFYENDPVRFDVIYGAINSTGADQNFVAGIQGPNGCFTQDFCVNPAPVQNVLHNYVGQVGGTPSPTPTGCSVTSPDCGGVVFGGPPTDFIVNLSDPADPATVQASDFTVNGTPADNDNIINGDQSITFHFNTSPAVEGQNTMHIAAGVFNCGNGPVQEFTCSFTYHASVPTPPEPSPTPTPTLTPTPTSTPRPAPTPRPRPTPLPRP